MSIAAKYCTGFGIADTIVGISDTNRDYGNLCETAEGKAICCYINNVAGTAGVYIALANSVIEVLAGEVAFYGDTQIMALEVNTRRQTNQCQLSLINGMLYLTIYYYDSTNTDYYVEIWRDTTGVGDAFDFYSDVGAGHMASDAVTLDESDNSYLTQLYMHSSGVFFLMVPYITSYLGVVTRHSERLWYSNDNGASWTAGYYVIGSYVNNYYSRSLVELPDGVLAYGKGAGYGTFVFYHNISYPYTPVSGDMDQYGCSNFPSASYSPALAVTEHGGVLLVNLNGIFKLRATIPATYLSILNGNNYDHIYASLSGQTTGCYYYNIAAKVLVLARSGDNVNNVKFTGLALTLPIFQRIRKLKYNSEVTSEWETVKRFRHKNGTGDDDWERIGI